MFFGIVVIFSRKSTTSNIALSSKIIFCRSQWALSTHLRPRLVGLNPLPAYFYFSDCDGSIARFHVLCPMKAEGDQSFLGGY